MAGISFRIASRSELRHIFTVRNEVAKVMFLQASVCPQGGISDQVHPPDQVHHPPWDQVHRPRAGTPPGPGTLPRPGTPPGTRYTPRDQVHPPRYGHCCGRYASYWNAFLYWSAFSFVLFQQSNSDKRTWLQFCRKLVLDLVRTWFYKVMPIYQSSCQFKSQFGNCFLIRSCWYGYFKLFHS